MENSSIEWTDHTFSPWEGCQRVSPGCEHCYAEARDTRWHDGENWGPKSKRLVHSDSYWRQPYKWDAVAAKAGERRRVFCASLADVFEDRRDLDVHRSRLWNLIEATPNLDWLLLTKRPENVLALVPERWREYGIPAWLGVTTENQEYADRRLTVALTIKARLHFASYEPALGPVNFGLFGTLPKSTHPSYTMVHQVLRWIICGGESGPGARPFNVDWARRCVQQCREADVACFVKQLGATVDDPTRGYFPASRLRLRNRKGNDMAEWPADLRVREFPTARTA